MSARAVRPADEGAWVAALLRDMRGKRVAVLGDLMLDEWLWGRVRRISPEAPVPVVEIDDHSYSLGGAGNVASNLAALGAQVAVVGVIGDDEAGRRVLGLLRKLGVDAARVTRVGKRPTTQKTRIVAHNQQVVRADRESSQPVDAPTASRLGRAVAGLDGAVDAVVVSDYGKGTVSGALVKKLRAFKHRAIVTGDPKPQNLEGFAGVDCISPNIAETESATGVRIANDADLRRAGEALLRKTGCAHVLVTRGEHGMTLFSRQGAAFTVPAVARQVYDVSGAGDTVVSALTLALAAGAPIERAVRLAGLAAGVVVEKLGTATATPAEILKFARVEGVAAAVRFAPKERRDGRAR